MGGKAQTAQNVLLWKIVTMDFAKIIQIHVNVKRVGQDIFVISHFAGNNFHFKIDQNLNFVVVLDAWMEGVLTVVFWKTIVFVIKDGVEKIVVLVSSIGIVPNKVLVSIQMTVFVIQILVFYALHRKLF